MTITKASRAELLRALERVRDTIGHADVLFDPDPHWEGEEARHDAASETLRTVEDLLRREKKP